MPWIMLPAKKSMPYQKQTEHSISKYNMMVLRLCIEKHSLGVMQVKCSQAVMFWVPKTPVDGTPQQNVQETTQTLRRARCDGIMTCLNNPNKLIRPAPHASYKVYVCSEGINGWKPLVFRTWWGNCLSCYEGLVSSLIFFHFVYLFWFWAKDSLPKTNLITVLAKTPWRKDKEGHFT